MKAYLIALMIGLCRHVKKQVTVVRKYSGDMQALYMELVALAQREVKQFHGRMEIKGFHVDLVKKWMRHIGT